MSDHRERACPHCGSLLHFAEECRGPAPKPVSAWDELDAIAMVARNHGWDGNAPDADLPHWLDQQLGCGAAAMRMVDGAVPTSVEGLATALQQRSEVYREAFDRLRDLATDETENEVYQHTFALQEAIVLVGCLRRLLQRRTVREIHAAFGAPGDFGYETPIGNALDRVYRGKP